MNANQYELFGAPEEKSYGGVNSVELPYWEENGKITSVALSNKLIVRVTYQKGGHIYACVPGWGRQEKRGKNAKINFLSAMALIRHSMELTESIAGHTQLAAEHNQSAARDAQQLGELLRTAEAKSLALEAENTRLGDELAAAKRQTPRVAEPQQIDFGGGFVLVLRPDLIRAVKNLGGDQVTMTQAFHVALIVGQLLYLITKGCGKVMPDGLRYIYGTYTEFQAKYFFFWSHRTIERSFVGAESLGLVTSKQPEGRFSRRKYYTPTPEAANLAASGKMAASSRQVGGFLEAAKMAASLIVQDKNTTDVAAAQPDKKRAQLLTLAATAADLSELAEKLKPFFPSHDVALQLRRCREWRRKRQLVEPEPTARAFIDWMLQAEIPLPPPKHKPPPAAPASLIAPEQVDPEQLARFQKELEERKARNAGKHAKRL